MAQKPDSGFSNSISERLGHLQGLVTSSFSRSNE